jgi:hypothetical protein
MRKDAPPSPGLLGPFGAVVGALFRRNGANISAQGNALGRRRHPNPRALPWADLLGPFGAGVGTTGNVLLHSVRASKTLFRKGGETPPLQFQKGGETVARPYSALL